MDKRITPEILNQPKKCSNCGKDQLVKEMVYHKIQYSYGHADYDLALFNCSCQGTNCVKIPRRLKEAL